MSDLGTLLQIVLAAAVTATPIAVIVLLIAGRDTDGAAASFRSATDLAWPVGVQEEDPQPWMMTTALSD